MDVASKGDLPHRDNDFGITLGRYGVKPGPYLFVPLIGPSSVRDGVGQVVDTLFDPVRLAHYPHRGEVTTGLTVVGGLDLRARRDEELRTLLSGAADPYATLRSVYQQDRQAEVEGREAPPAILPEFEPEPSAPPVEPSGPPPPEALPPVPAPEVVGHEEATP
jgi:phospholipid-binding lipoprotein MlaA